MPAGMSAIRKALVARMNNLANLPDFTAYPQVPDSVVAPAGFIEPDRPFVDYQKVFQSGQIEWKFELTLLVNRYDEESSQELLDSYLDPLGPFVTALQNMDAEDELAELVSYVTVTGGTRYGAYTIGGTTYLGAQLLLCVSG